MKKYFYGKEFVKDLSVKPFLKLVKDRNQHIDKASDVLPKWGQYNENALADALHPSVQHVIVDKVEKLNNAVRLTLTPSNKNNGKELAFFRAGQYISMNIEIDKKLYSRPYSISSSPKKALGKNSSYCVTIKNNKDGFTSKYINEKYKKGVELNISGPLGEFYHTALRDSNNVVAVAGGSGITPFIAMAEAIADKTEEFDLTIIYGVRDRKSLLFKKELDTLVKKTKNVKVVYVLEKERVKGYEHGFITEKIINKYAKGDYSLFVCGPRGLYNAMDNIISKLKLPLRRYRKEVFGEYGDPSKDKDFPKIVKGKTFNVTVKIRADEYHLKCKSNETLLNAMEKAGIHAPSHCRSGECGWCHSLLKEGKIYTPKSIDGRRLADHTYNWIHPCASYPLSDIVLEVAVNPEDL